MASIGEDRAPARYAVVRTLRRSVEADPARAALFMAAHGVAALKPWLETVLTPGASQKDASHERVVHEVLEVLQLVPVTRECLQKSGIARTLIAIRSSYTPAQETSTKLLSQWKTQFHKELLLARATAANTAKISSADGEPKSKLKLEAAPEAALEATSEAKRVHLDADVPSTNETATKKPRLALPAPTTQTPASRAAPTVHSDSPASSSGSARSLRMTAPKQQPPKSHVEPQMLRHLPRPDRQDPRKAEELEATIRELFLLGEVLERGRRQHEPVGSESKSSAASSTDGSQPSDPAVPIVEIDLCDA